VEARCVDRRLTALWHDGAPQTLEATNVKLADHPQVEGVVLSHRVSMPDPNVHRILVVHTTLPLSKKQAGYDHDQLGSFIEFVGGHMEEAGAEKAEIVSTDGVWGVELTNPALSES
jgi:hypothetical protein